MRRPALVLVVLLALAGCSRGGAAPTQTQRGDPALRVALAVMALERSGEQPLSPDQARQVLPLLKVLRDTSPDDRQVSQAIADQILAILTPDQRAALERLREQAQERAQRRGQGRPPGPGVGGPGPGGPGSGGASPDPARRAEVRRRAVDRAIRVLESKVR